MKKILVGLLVGLGIVGGTYYFVAQKETPQTPPVQQQVMPPGEHGEIAAPVPVSENPIKLENSPLGGMVGATIPTAVARFETSLASKLTAAATSMTLSSDPLYTKIGTHLTGPVCFTIDEGTTVVEDVCGTANGTAITGLTRGISPLTGTSSIASLMFQHGKGASVKVTDSPQIIINSRILNGNESLPNPIRYDLSISTSTIASNSGNLASVGLVLGTALQGAPTATTTLPGVVQIGTTAQIAAGTGMSGLYTLVPAGSMFNQTSSANTLIPVTNSSGKLSQGFLDLTTNFTFTGVFTTTATTTLATTSVAGIDVGSHLSKFGGSGADGALNITSGTTTISAAGAAILEKNYTSISITATGSLAFSNPNTNGTVVYLRSQGACTITSSANPTVDLRNMGGATTTAAVGLTGFTVNPGVANATTNGGAGGAAPSNVFPKNLLSRVIFATPGAGGASSTGGSSGGRGGGSVVFECAGGWNFVSPSVINASGTKGINGIGSGSGAGGGGAGGSIIVIYSSLVADSGTYTLTGGAGGDSSSGPSTGAGGGGANRVAGGAGNSAGTSGAGNAGSNDDGNGGAGGAGPNQSAGGGGAGGWKLVTPNYYY